MYNKRGAVEESATRHVASIVILILILILIYMLLIPKAAREDLLAGRELKNTYGDERTSDYRFDDRNGYDYGSGRDGNTLLVVSPGRVFPRTTETEVRTLPSIPLSKTSVTDRQMLSNSLRVSRSLFSNNEREIVFNLDENKLNDLSLFFRVDDSRGRLNIFLNDNLVYSGDADSGDLPIKLPVSLLRSTNRLIFELGSRGTFLTSDYFELDDVELIKKNKLETNAQSRRFNVDKDKLGNDNELRFFVDCKELKEANLNVDFNQRNVFFGRIVCDAAEHRVELDDEFFVDGFNLVSFSVDQGNYVLEDVKLVLDLKDGNQPIYYFNVDKDELGNEFILKLDLLEIEDDDADIEGKRAEFLINSGRFSMFTERDVFEKDISDLIVQGENYIKVLPKNDFEIVNLQVVME